MMKTLDEWLASSSSDEEQGEISATVSPGTLARSLTDGTSKAQKALDTELRDGVQGPTETVPGTAMVASESSALNAAAVAVNSTILHPLVTAPDNVNYIRDEVYVVDRGTQTVTTTATQTDPLPQENGISESLLRHLGIRLVPDDTTYSQIRGVDGRPYRQLFSDYEQRNAQRASELREQLDFLQNSVEMLIARYNLPPPPTLQ